MRTIGLLGGMSWSSTIEYYRIINQEVARRLGGLHSAKIIVNSLDFGEIELLQRQGDWERAGELLASAAQALERAGADLLLIGAITMHKVSETVEQAVRIPFIHAADVLAEHIRAAGIVQVGLLGTLYTMEQHFLKQKLAGHGVEVVIPDKPLRDEIHRIIFQELCKGQCTADSRERSVAIIQSLLARGAEGVVFGCTELSLLLGPGDVPAPVFDAAELHAKSAVRQAFGP